MSPFILMPLAAIIAVFLICLDLKIAFFVFDKTEKTGFNFGFYLMTFFGLVTTEVSMIVYLF